jgi:hypothetical protein
MSDEYPGQRLYELAWETMMRYQGASYRKEFFHVHEAAGSYFPLDAKTSSRVGFASPR